MTLSEVLTLLAFIVSLLVLLVEVVDVTFSIAWKISHEKDEHNETC